MTSIYFFVPGNPVGRDTGQTPSGGHYTTAEGKRWRRTIAGYALACPDRPTGEPWQGHVTITAIFVLQRPATHFLPTGELSASGRRFPRPTSKPDVSNIVKIVEEVFSAHTKTRRGLGWWRDDAQITDLHTCKRWAEPGDPPGVHLTIRLGGLDATPESDVVAVSGPRTRRRLPARVSPKRAQASRSLWKG